MTIQMPPPTSKAEKFRARANACVEQAGNCSTEREKHHWLTPAEDWLRWPGRTSTSPSQGVVPSIKLPEPAPGERLHAASRVASNVLRACGREICGSLA